MIANLKEIENDLIGAFYTIDNCVPMFKSFYAR